MCRTVLRSNTCRLIQINMLKLSRITNRKSHTWSNQPKKKKIRLHVPDSVLPIRFCRVFSDRCLDRLSIPRVLWKKRGQKEYLLKLWWGRDRLVRGRAWDGDYFRWCSDGLSCRTRTLFGSLRCFGAFGGSLLGKEERERPVPLRPFRKASAS